MAKKQSPWKERLANMSAAEREAYKKADNARVAAYRAKKKAKREAHAAGQPLPPPEPRPSRATHEEHLALDSPIAADAQSVPVAVDGVSVSRSLFTQYMGISVRPEWQIRPLSMPFHRSDFVELGLVPTDDVREVPRQPFSMGERLHDRARLYQATNEQRIVWLGVDDRAEEAAAMFVRRAERRAKAAEAETPAAPAKRRARA